MAEGNGNGNGNENENETGNGMLAPPQVVALKEEASAGSGPPRGQMERTVSEGIREERDDLIEVAEQSLIVIMDLGLNGLIRWVSPSWEDVVGTSPADVQGKPIADLLLDNQSAFADMVESMKSDDSRSRIVRFMLQMGPSSKLAEASVGEGADAGEEGDAERQDETASTQSLALEGQGIMVYDRSSGGESHTMWMLRPSAEPREVTIDLPSLLVESLGVGAEMLARYLNSLAEVGANDPGNHAPPLPVLCRICERQIPPWWFEKHTELCLQEHRAESEVQMAHESLTEHRSAIVKVLDSFEARSGRPTSGEIAGSAPAPPEYKGCPIGPSSTPSSGPSSGTVSPATPPSRSREPSVSGLSHSRARSFAVRRPLWRIVELILDLCDTALEINTPAIKDSLASGGELRTQSPLSESRISQVLQWQSPSANTLEQEKGLALLCADTENVARAKLESVLRHRRILEYSERIRNEFTVLVQDCIDEAMRKAARLAAGQLSDSSTDDDGSQPLQDDGPALAGSSDGPSSLARALRSASESSLYTNNHRSSSVALSTRSSSPKECPTPRSHKSAFTIQTQSQRSKTSSMFFESDAADSDSSVRSSVLSAPNRTNSPAPEPGLSRAASSRERHRHRRSVIIPGAASPRRQVSPGRMIAPPSPLTISKPRLPISQETIASPITSPLLSAGEFSSPPVHPQHHRRQSSAASSEVLRPVASPRLNASSHPQVRAVPPSIKDFEIIKPISKGAFGSVYLSKKKSTGDYFAIKVLKKADMVAKNQVTNVKAERAIMMWQGESDFVAKLYWTFSSKDYLYLVMEYLNGGDCASLIKVLGGLPEDWAKKYLAEVVLGVEHLHGRGIVHRDLKPDNLLIDQKGHLKLTDFGLSRMGLIGRQKRVLNSNQNDAAPDLLKQGPFARAMSVASSRSASFDFHGGHSPGSTPHMTPDTSASLSQPSYFSLNRENTLSREHSRRRSGYRSDSGGSDSLHTLFSSFSLTDSASFPSSQRRAPIEEESRSDGSFSPDMYGSQPPASQASAGQNNTPPQPSMMPPPMALFDPEDSNRRFVGTPDYLAPETINGVGQDEMSDWWSLGCILFEFLYGYPPFHAPTPDKVFESILERRIAWPDEEEDPVSPEVKDLMNKLMCTNPRDRLGSNIDEKFTSGGHEIRNHPWFEGIHWETLLQDEAQFIPNPENPEDTEYFDARGATLQTFAEEMEDQIASPSLTPSTDFHDRPHDALNGVRSQVNSMKRGLMPLHIPAHVRDGRSRRLSEPVATDDFGSFAFKNLPVLEKANKDVIQKLRAEAMQAQSKQIPAPTSQNLASPAPSLEGSPVLPMPLKRQLSSSKGNNRAASPSNFNQSNASPSRSSQPSSPLLVSFTAGQNHERRKTSSTSSSLSHHSGNSLQPGNFFDAAPPRLATGLKTNSTASSPVKHTKPPPPLQLSPQKGPSYRQASAPTSRARSQTVGSQDPDSPAKDPFHHKRRSGVFDMSPSSSDNEETRANALLRVQKRRQSSRRMSQICAADGPIFRPLDVLICEDHPVSRMVMEKLLEKLRCRTITVGDGSEAMRYAMSEVKFDIIMMEFKLPQINGADVARMIRDTKNANAHTPIVAVTGYLKELQAPHHFDGMIEKPPTTSKLVDVMSKLCQWKAPPPGNKLAPNQNMPPSGLRQESMRLGDSPSSTSSGFAQMPGSTFRGSSREDSISSSFFGDSESVLNDDFPVIISRNTGDDWGDNGLGLSDESFTEQKPLVSLTHHQSAPAEMQSKTIQKQRSAEKVRAKRVLVEKNKYEGAESGDDEDEELGDVQVRTKSPNGKSSRGSKLGTEMLRTNSRGSVISNSEISFRGAINATAASSPPLPQATTAHRNLEMPEGNHHSATTPPEIFHQAPGDDAVNVDMDATPRPRIQSPLETEDPTPRPQSSLNQQREEYSTSK
ncbi:MAG: rim15, signal transduction response regulator [Sclerophora amabilis]|nr:MAG: rim15, signal transduction response regulator [Sclerophora amabilis]